jgi:DNA-binding MarR family transcriptional regulator
MAEPQVPASSDVPDGAVDPLVTSWVAMVPEINPAVEGIVERVHLLSRYFDRLSSGVAAPHGLTPRDYDILARLFWVGDPHRLTPTQLAAGTQAPATTITSRLDKLERAGLVSRLADPRDRRSLLAQLTEDGLALFRTIVVEQARAENSLVGQLPEADLATLRELLSRLMDICEQQLGRPVRRVDIALDAEPRRPR